jgi:hypothetical protein
MQFAMTKKKVLALIIFVGVGQLVAFLYGLWLEFPNGHIIMLISSLVGFIFGYKEEPSKQ